MAYLLSILALLSGPFIYAWGRRLPTAKQILDGFVLITIAGIVCVYIIPDAIGSGGYLAIVFLLAGLAFPVLLEHAFHHSIPKAHVFIVVLAAAGLMLHAIIDGIALLPEVGDALASQGPQSDLTGSMRDSQLAVGVILHRVPVGMAIWWSVRPSFGTGAAVTTFAMLIIATGFAWFFGAPIVELAETRSLAWFQAFVAGSLVHVVAFGVSHRHEGDEVLAGDNSWGFRAGILLGMFLLFTAPQIH